LPDYTSDSFMEKAKKLLTEIRIGLQADKYGWNTVISK